jgi:hypothetical protein
MTKVVVPFFILRILGGVPGVIGALIILNKEK